MRNWLLTLIFMVGTTFAGERYHQDHILFCIKKEKPRLSKIGSNTSTPTNNQHLNEVFEKFGIVKVEKWLPNTDERDVTEEVDLSRIYKASFSADVDMQKIREVIGKLKIIEDVQFAEPQRIHKINAVNNPIIPMDPSFSKQWYLKKIMADYAWGLWDDGLPGDSTILVGVVDTGVDYLHPDLQNVMFINLGEDTNGDGIITEADENNFDDDGNGYIDDFMGWDFGGADGSAQDNDVRPPESGTYNELSHGTHVAGVIAAQADNNVGIAGISYRSRLIVSKNAADEDLTEPGIRNGYTGILYCAKLGAKIINCSWGGPGTLFTHEKAILNNVTTNYDALVVCAAGNENSDNDSQKHYPSDYDKCISVSALRVDDKKAYYSNYGSVVDISAPGGEGSSSSNAIYSTIHDNAGGYASWQGTSMASPVVAGAAALMRAWFPDKDREWITNALLFHADYVDDKNTAYAGQLGTGRVNIYHAIARTLYPSIIQKDIQFEINDLNNNNGFNPGESGSVVMTIENQEFWNTAKEVELTFHSNEYITFSDSVLNLGTMYGGNQKDNQNNPLEFAISDQAPVRPIDVAITITANLNEENPYTLDTTFEIPISMSQSGFPISDFTVSLPLAVGNILPASGQEIVTIADNESLYVHTASGATADGFPVHVGFTRSAPVIADINADGSKEIVAANRSGKIWILQQDGGLLKSFTIGEQIFRDFAVANLDEDDELEIVFGTMSKRLHIVNYDSTELDGFPKEVHLPVDQGIALADLNGEPTPELIYGTFDGFVHAVTVAGDTVGNFPIKLNARLNNQPVVADSGDTKIIVLTTYANDVVIVSAEGEIIAEYNPGSRIASAPGFADIDGDQIPEIFFGTQNGELFGIKSDGSLVESFPINTGHNLSTSPVFADLNNDGILEVAANSGTGLFLTYSMDGQSFTNFPIELGGHLNGSAVITDLDNDEDLEIIAGGSSGLQVLDVPDQKGTAQTWRTYLGSNHRTGYLGDITTSLGGSKLTRIPDDFRLMQNYPNPFNPQTTISYELSAPGKVQIRIFNTLGQQIEILVDELQTAGIYNVNYDAGDLSSGIYFYQLSINGFRQVKKMVLLQ